MKKDILFQGCGSAVPTPFDHNNKINFKEWEHFLEFQIENKVDALIVCGTTGESSTLSQEEKKDLIKSAIAISDGRVPIIAGTGSNNTKQAIQLSEMAVELGVDGLLLVTPYYNKTTQQGLIQHYQAIAQSVFIPILLYNVPSRTGVNIDPETCLALSKIENIVGIKEASGNLSQVAQIAHLCEDQLTIYSGNDDQVIPICSLGGKGVISVLSNVLPKYTHEMIKDFLDGFWEEAKEKQLKVLPLIQALFSEVNPIPIKSALSMIGYDFGNPRLPLLEMSLSKREKLKIALEKSLTF